MCLDELSDHVEVGSIQVPRLHFFTLGVKYLNTCYVEKIFNLMLEQWFDFQQVACGELQTHSLSLSFFNSVSRLLFIF